MDGAGFAISGNPGWHITGVCMNGRVRVTVKNMVIESFFFGIYFSASSTISVFGNVIFNNAWVGVYVSSSSAYADIFGNSILNNSESGIYIFDSAETYVFDNYVAGNKIGVHIDHAWRNHVYSNNVVDNSEGVTLASGSSENSVVGNNLTSNECGVLLKRNLGIISSNKFYRNSFVDNIAQVNVVEGCVNTWDDGYPSGGNYWSDYTGIDEKNGPHQDLLGSDGMGDTQYIINAENRDHYPLMVPLPTTVKQIEVSGFNVYRVGDTVFGAINFTYLEARSDCMVQFQVMDPQGRYVHEENRTVSLPATEVSIFFTWLSGNPRSGDYYSRFRVMNSTNAQLFDSGWFHGFNKAEQVFIYDLGILQENDYRAYSSPLNILRGQQAVFSFSRSSWVEYIKISMEGARGSDILAVVGNESLQQTSTKYILDQQATMRILNVPEGSYNFTFIAVSDTVQLTNVSIETGSKSNPALSYKLTDKTQAVNRIEGLCNATRTYMLLAGFCTNTTEQISFSIINATGTLAYSGVSNATLFALKNSTEFTFDYQLPMQETTSSLTFNLTLVESRESVVWSVPLVSKNPPCTIDLRASSEVRYYKMPSALKCILNWGDHYFHDVDSEDLEALNVTDVKIVDIGVESNVLRNVTINFKAKNTYVWRFLWMSAYVYYDLYVSPVRVLDGDIEVMKSFVAYDETEEVTVSGVPVVYVNGLPQVDFSIEFRKSVVMNIIDWVFRKGLKLLVQGYAADVFGEIAIAVMNAVADYFKSSLSADDVWRILYAGATATIQHEIDDLLVKSFGTHELPLLLEHIGSYSLIVFIMDHEPGFAWRIIGSHGGSLVRSCNVSWKVLRRSLGYWKR